MMLSKNALEVAAEEKGEIQVKLLPFPSKEAEERGVDIAPAIVIDGKILITGVASKEDIKNFIEKAKITRIGIILTKAHGDEDSMHALSIANGALAGGDKADVFLISDGVLIAKKGQKPDTVEKLLTNVIAKGGEIFASEAHLKAFGLKDKIISGIKVSDKPYDDLVDLIMEKWDKVVIF